MERLIRHEFTVVPAGLARSRIARCFLEFSGQQTIGSVRLKEHQVHAAGLLGRAISEFGGGILCDPVGTGKTFTALSLAGPDSTTIVVGPAVLREMWMTAARQADRRIDFVSFERLSRSFLPSAHGHALLIVDEAHHARNPSTRRHGMLSRLASTIPTVMLTATPVHNRRTDLIALLRVFLGDRASSLTPAELGRCVIRRDAVSGLPGIPRIRPVHWLRIDGNDSIPELLLCLPPPLPLREGGDAGALVIHSLLRQWASSDAALEGALRRRLLQSDALISALDDGVFPSRAELGSWAGAEDCVQLAFSSLLAPATGQAGDLLEIVRAHRQAVASLRSVVRADSTADDDRASLVNDIRTAHKGERIVAFSSCADTVGAMFKRLSHDGGVAELSGSGARVAGGQISRRDAIQSFAPRAAGRRCARDADDITLLLTTDLLSEGVNLQDASVVIHLDLPWTPARLEQRVGRAARIGSSHKTVATYAFHPPISAERLVRIESILRSKAVDVRTVTPFIPSLAGLSDETDQPVTTYSTLEAIRSHLALWDTGGSAPGTISAAVTCSDQEGFLALCMRGRQPVLLASRGNRITDDPRTVLECIEACEGPDTEAREKDVQDALASLTDWMHATRVLDGIRPSSSRIPARDLGLRRIASAVRNARPHSRARITALAADARAMLGGRLNEFVEQEIADLVARRVTDTEWLESLRTLLRRSTLDQAGNRQVPGGVVAIILFTKRIALSRATER